MLEHDQIDDYIDQRISAYRGSGKSIYCRRGCCGCCSMAVHATYPEAVTVAGNLETVMVNRLSNYIDRLQTILPTLTDLKSYLQEHRRQLGPCPFLGDGGVCSIYAMRPLSCRSLLSTRPADWCTVDFSELDQWDRLAYESALDREAVAWPTHYLAAPREVARRLEGRLLAAMHAETGWSLSGNFAMMVWLESKYGLSQSNSATARQLLDAMNSEQPNYRLPLHFATEASGSTQV